LDQTEREKCIKLLGLFQIDNKPANLVLTEGEIEIFHAIVFRPKNRVQILCSTQYGKSMTVALACIIVSCIQGELIAVVAPKDEKAKIIMRYYIDHLGDNILFYSQLEKDTKLERLRMEESKERIGLRNRGGIYVLSAQASNSQKGIEAAMGAGAKIVISDESSLIPDIIESTIFRMIAGQGPDAFYCKIGNPFYRNHFYTSWHDDNYHKIFIDYKKGLQEGRYTEQFIEEAKKKPNFDILFGCVFPPEDMIDEKGYIRLFTTDEIETAKRKVEPFGEQRLGIDMAEGGGDYNAFVIRTANYAGLMLKYRNEDTMLIPGHIIQIHKELEMRDENLFMDTIGVGKGPYDRLCEQRYHPTSVKFSEKADDEVQFANLKAECFWRLKQWINTGGCLDPDDNWNQLLDIKYKVDSSGRIQIISKDDLRREGKASPDIADALAMTFARRAVIASKDMKEERETMKQFDFYKKEKASYFTGSRY
jgi:hypothetical protein